MARWSGVPEPARWRLVLTSDPIEVTSNSPRADTSWRFVDAAGHEHRYDGGYLTLTWVEDETYWCDDCRDDHADGHYECPLCGEHITPGTTCPPPFREFIPGPTYGEIEADDGRVFPLSDAEVVEVQQIRDRAAFDDFARRVEERHQVSR